MVTTLRDLVVALFGSYTPPSYTEYHWFFNPVDGSGYSDVVNVIPAGSAGIDWPWIAGVALFALTLYCVFRLIGGILK